MTMNTENNVATAARQMEPIEFGNLLINFTTEFNRIWDSRGSGSKPASFWRPTPAPDLLPGYFPLGDIAIPGYGNINGNTIVAVVCEGVPKDGDTSIGKALCPPDDFERVWRDSGSGAAADCTIWRPVPPAGYVALGLVCSNGRDKPLSNTVRCVRADLVVASHISNRIWSDSGSGASQDFSAWAIAPPSAAAGEIYLSPGTFVGANSHTRPATDDAAYSLRARIPLQVDAAPEAPSLSSFEPPAPEEMAKITHTARLPWFAVKDPQLTPLEQFHASAFYRLERSDRYVLVGHGHNTSIANRNYRWTAPRLQTIESLEAFTNVTTIRVVTEWPLYVSNPEHLFQLMNASIRFSARLSNDFTHTQASPNGWLNSAAVEVISRVEKNKSVVAYLMQSDYRLLREDGTQVASDIRYTDTDSLHFSEYPPEKNSEVLSPNPMTEPPVATDTAP
jgi:hypothetical protein